MSSKLLTGKLTFASLPPLDLSVCNKDEIRAYFENSYDLNESVFTCLKDPNSLYKCPDRLRLPLVFYYTHTAVVYVNKLLLAGLLKERVNATFETMFETGVDEMSWDDTENYRMGGSYKWPSVEEIVEYRRNVRNIILKLIVDTPLQLPITMDSPWWGLVMGMEHERIHLETSSVLLRQLPVHLVEKPQHWMYAPRAWESGCKGNKMVHVAGGEVTLGKPNDFPSFGWDNEYGEAKCSVPEFEASQYLITNKEFLQFVQDGGYQRQDLWTKEAWQWVQYRQARHPTFWVCEEGCKGGCGADLAAYSPCAPRENNNAMQNGFGHTNGFLDNQPVPYRYRAMFDMIEMPWDWPVDVNYHEAKAFCCWKGPQFRLPAEAEHHLMRGPQLPVAMGTKSDIIYQEKSEANVNLRYGSSTPVNMFAPTETGFSDVFGNVWEWTEDHFNGLDSFDTHFLYDDFSSPCFDGKHNVILGGSWVSTGSEASRFARYAFRRHFFQHLGFRVARSMPQGNNKMPMRLVNTEVFMLGSGLLDNTPMFDTDAISLVPSTNLQYRYDAATPPRGILELEFGFRDSLPAATATFATNVMRGCNIPMTSAMYVGSATGRGPFELSKYFDQVLGVEVCSRLIDAALRLQTGNALAFGEGLEATMNADMKPERVVFKQLTWLPNEVNSHNLVIMSHLERVQNPKAWLVRLKEVISHNGLAVVVSADGVWNKDTLHEHLHHRLHCVDTQQLAYSSPSGKGTAAVTVWRHK
nr:conA [Conus imperialis]